MFKKLLGVTSIALLATVASVGVAAAQDAYPLGDDSITADDTTVAPGEAMVLGVQVCNPGTAASFTLDSSTSLGSATANDAGRATLTATIPSNTAPGSHSITGSCTGPDGQPVTQVLGFTVTAATGSGNIPTTGSANTAPMTQIAIAAIAGGGLLVLLANRRRSTTVDDRETAGV